MSMEFTPVEQRAAERERMVDSQLAPRGIRDERVLAAMRAVPREWFVPAELAPRAYDDSALQIECGQTISQPYMVAAMTQLAEVTPGARVLEIGTGSGYQCAVLLAMGADVWSVEWQLQLMLSAAERLAHFGRPSYQLRCGDGTLGWPTEAPFDAIVVTAGAPDVPAALRSQLRVGGRLVLPVGGATEQTLVRIRRAPSGFSTEEQFGCRFVKLLGKGGWR